MKKISSVISLSVLFILLFVTPVIGSEDWVKIYYDDESVCLYNKVSIKHLTKDIVQVWEKTLYSYKGKEETIEWMTKSGLSTEGYDKLSENRILYEIDCEKKRMRILSINEYDIDGKVLFSRDNIKSEWNNIIPDSNGYNLRKKVCK